MHCDSFSLGKIAVGCSLKLQHLRPLSLDHGYNAVNAPDPPPFRGRVISFPASSTPSSPCRMEVEKIGSCVVIHMKFGENRFNPNFVSAFLEALDKAEAYEDATALVTIGEGKYYSLGLDLEKIATMSGAEIMQFSNDIQKLVLRLLTFPLVTVAAINGHVYAAGVFLVLAQDYMIMRNDRGWFCLPEINLKRLFSVAVMELAKARIPSQEHQLAIVLGKKYTATEAKAAGIVNEVSSMEKLKSSAIAAANRLAGEGLDRKTLAALKHDLHRDIVQALKEPVRFYSLL